MVDVPLIISKALEFTQLEKEKFAVECDIKPDTLNKAIVRNQESGGLIPLSDELVRKIHDRFGIRKVFLKEGIGPIEEENITSVHKRIDNKKNHPSLDDAIRMVIEEGTEYYVIPKVIFQKKYILVAEEQFNKDFATLSRVLGLLEDQIHGKESRPKPHDAEEAKQGS